MLYKCLEPSKFGAAHLFLFVQARFLNEILCAIEIELVTRLSDFSSELNYIYDNFFTVMRDSGADAGTNVEAQGVCVITP